MDWKAYEKVIHEYLQHQYPNATILYNQILRGKISRSERQIDILIEEFVAGHKIRIIIDSKYYKNKKIDVKDVESFLGMLHDCECYKGVLITTKGYTQGATKRVFYDTNKEVELDILNFDELKKYDSFGGVIHRDNGGAIISAPFGWILDGEAKPLDFLVSFYLRGRTFKKAAKEKELIYANIIPKGDSFKTLDNFVRFQENYTKAEFPNSTIEYWKHKINKDRCAIFREISNVKFDYREITGFLEFDHFLFYAVLITPKELYKKNLRKLEFILDKLIPLNVIHKKLDKE